MIRLFAYQKITKMFGLNIAIKCLQIETFSAVEES